MRRHLCQLGNLLVSHDLMLIEEKQDEHLVGRGLKLVLGVIREEATQLGRPQTQLPVQLPPVIEFGKVVLCEGVHCS